jgi:hypothetical protein
MKVDVSLIGDGFSPKDLQVYLTKANAKYKLKILQELGEPAKMGFGKGKSSKWGFCWLNGITLRQLSRIGKVLKTYKVEDIAINVKQEDVQDQTCIYVSKELIDIAAQLDATIEIVKK